MKLTLIFGITWTLYWIVLPIILFASVIFRFNVLSCVYLLLVLILPYSPKLSPDKIGTWSSFALASVITSGLFLLGHAGFQIALLATPPYGSLMGKGCSDPEKIARYVGFERFDNADAGSIVRLLLPDIAVFLVSLITYVSIRKTRATMTALSSNGDNRFEETPKASSVRLKNASILCLTLLFMALAGIAYPSVVSFVYLFVFLIHAVMWALHRPLLVPGFAALRAALTVLTILQLLLLYLYQMQFMQTLLSANALYSRLVGLTAIIYTDCNATYMLLLQPNVNWTEYVSPGCIFLLHWFLAVGVRMFYQDLQVLTQPLSQNTSARSSPQRTKNAERKGKKSGYEETPATLQPLVLEEELPHNYDAMSPSGQTNMESLAEQDNEQVQSEETDQKEGILLKISRWFDEFRKYSFYVLALVIMMLWSVTYHSWLTFVLLLWSCILWMTKDRAKYTLYCSPLFVFYGICLVLLQYIYSLDLTDSELPQTINESSGSVLDLTEFGLHRYTNPGLHLGSQILYLCGFLIVLHQFNYYRKRMATTGEYQVAQEKTFMERAASFVNELLCKYWVFLVIAFHLAVATEGYPSGIKIIYMALFLLNMVVYSVSWTLWRKTLSLYWTVLVIYTMIVLVLIYTYQFSSFPTYWKSFTNFTDAQLNDLGLKQSDPGTLLLRILVPTVFLLIVILQLQYFNKKFLEYTGSPTQIARQASGSSEQQVEQTSPDEFEMNELQRGTSQVKEEESQKTWFSRLFNKWAPIVASFWNEVTSFFGRLLEFHLWRLVFVTVFTAAVYQISALYAVFVLVWVLLLPFRKTHLPLFVISSFAASLILLGTMFYQLQFIAQDVNLIYNCTIPFYGVNITKSIHLTHWIGVNKMALDGVFFFHSEGYIAIVLMVAFERTVIRRQKWRRLWRNEPAPVVTAFYPSITYKEVDDGLLNCAKFFINYFFFKFGVQACFVMTVVTVWVHNDIFSIFYSALLIVALTLRTRASLYKFWRFYVGILVVLILWQYLAELGMPPMWCQDNEYPWTIIGTNETVRNRLVLWLHLPDYIVTVHTMPSIADFFQLLFVVSQLMVFRKEAALTKYIGDNRYLTGKELDDVTIHNNPKKNFMVKGSRSLLDQAKGLIFSYTIWLTMAFIFFAGTSRISIFSLGYLICFFYLLSNQQQLLMGKPSRLLNIFTGFLGYTVAVITLKAGLQIASCVYIETLADEACWFVQLMSLVCAKPEEYELTDQTAASCELPYDNAGLTWDFICFLFLLIQLRIFASYYFLHVAEDLRIAMKLASRGAELFHAKLIEEVNEREQIQEENISAIKKSMKKIREAYQTLQRSLTLLKNHTDATRSGDYYMFDESASRKDLAKTKEDEKDEILDPIDLLHIADTVGIKEALSERANDKKRLASESEDKTLGEKEKDKEKDTTSTEEEVVYEDDTVGVKVRKKPDVVDSGRKSPVAEGDSGAKFVKIKSSGSHSEDEDGDSDEEMEEENMSFWGKVKQSISFVWELLMSGIDSFTLFLNQQNKDYRNVHLQLSAEKDYLCEKNFKSTDESRSSTSTDVKIDIEGGDAATADVVRKPSSLDEYVETRPIDFDKDQNRALRLFYALWFIIIARTDLVCYFLIILNLMLRASLLALVLPLAVFLWATFSIPRPTKTFWLFSIFYLEVVIVIRFIFQFEFFPWNSLSSTNRFSNDPFWWPRFIGIEQLSGWSIMDLLQLLAIFFHISILKVNGLWDKVEVEADEDTDYSGEDDVIEDRPSTSHEAVSIQEQEEKGKKEKEDKKSFIDKMIRVVKMPCVHLFASLNLRFSSVTDVYLYMFLCDVINFLIVIFGYNAFGPFVTATEDVVSNLQANYVPTGFLVMLLIQFLMMFIDRAIYLKRSLFAKIIFQVVLVIGIHVWMFFILPSVNRRPFYDNHVAQTYYFFKAIYFFLSAYQIRAGYPRRVTGNFLTKAHGTVNLFLFKGYRAIPFLAEITAIMDWMYTGTSLGFGEWMKARAVHAEVFELKCWRTFEDAYPSPRGHEKKLFIKYLVGGLLLFLLLGVIWFPLLLMNIALTIGGITNNPIQVDVKLSLGAFQPIFQVVADSEGITTWNEQRFNQFSAVYSKDENTASFLQRFSQTQVVSVGIDGKSKTIWIISPPQRQLLIEKLNPASNTSQFRVLFEWTIRKDPSKTTVSTSYGFQQIMLGRTSPARRSLYELLAGKHGVSNVTIPGLFPQFLHSPGIASTALPVSSLYADDQLKYLGVNLVIQTEQNGTVTSWWRVNAENSSSFADVRPNQKSAKINMVVFSDKVSPSSLSFLVNYGIIGLYVSVVLVVGRLVRTTLIGSTASLMFNELPNVDRILELCDDLFLVREEAEYELEEDLYAKLIFLYRSPKLLIDWTRKPKLKTD